VNENKDLTIENPDALDIEDPLGGDIIHGASNRVAVSASNAKANYVLYLLIPAIFLTVTLLGGLRLAGADSGFIFLPPPLICLVFSVLLFILFFRGGLLSVSGWFSEDLPTLTNVANASVLLTVFAACAQIFNSLLPEGGVPFWIVSFCFFWTLWNDLFLDFDAKRFLRSTGGLLGLAFVVKYLFLQYFTAPSSQNWLTAIFENPGKEAFTWLLDLPRYSPATGYIQFFTLLLFFGGLFLLPRSTKK